MNGPSFQSYYLDIEKQTREILNRASVDYLLEVDFEVFLQSLVDRFAFEPLNWSEADMTVEKFIRKTRIRDFGQESYVDQPQFRLRLPVSNHPNLSKYLDHQPSSQLSTAEPRWSIQEDVLMIEVDADEYAVKRAIEEVRYWLGGRNRDIAEGNQNLRERVRAVWKRRREELEAQVSELNKVAEKLKIPLYQSPTAPKPVPIQPKAHRKPWAPPSTAAKQAEPELRYSDVLGVIEFVEAYSRQLEVSPAVYSRLTEEDLRDLVLGMLNVNFPGSTGESFSKLGKTDMLLQIGGVGSLIVECKKWSGQKNYIEALAQLFRYLTWRHSYGVLLAFCTSKNMTSVVSGAKSAVGSHESLASAGLKEQSASAARFSSIHIHPQDPGKNVELFHLFVDLSL